MIATNRPHAHRSLALLLLVLALLVFAARGAGHGHDAPPRAGDTLCAICVYGGPSLGGVADAPALPAVPFWHLPPHAPGYRVVAAPVPLAARIRGPPSVA